MPLILCAPLLRAIRPAPPPAHGALLCLLVPSGPRLLGRPRRRPGGPPARGGGRGPRRPWRPHGRSDRGGHRVDAWPAGELSPGPRSLAHDLGSAPADRAGCCWESPALHTCKHSAMRFYFKKSRSLGSGLTSAVPQTHDKNADTCLQVARVGSGRGASAQQMAALQALSSAMSASSAAVAVAVRAGGIEARSRRSHLPLSSASVPPDILSCGSALTPYPISHSIPSRRLWCS